MSKLFLFAVGGTGERVVTSLVMLLASGMKIDSEIIPVFFDTDANSKALDRVMNLIKNYRNIRNELETFRPKYSNPFFFTEISEPVKVVIDGRQVDHLKNLIDLQNLPRNGKVELDLLFSQANLEMPLYMGFIGNPNIGSIALNYLLEETQYRNIQARIGESDKVFIISSIFGGTGAAGFPLILNKLRREKNIGDPNSNIIVGGASVLPYFEFKEKSAKVLDRKLEKYKNNVDSEAFTAKTKAALMYYDVNVIGNGLSSLYYLGDDTCRSQYKKVLGGRDQDNPASLIEVLSAMSVFHFSKEGKYYDEEEGTLFYNYALNLTSNIRDIDLSSIPEKDSDLKRTLVRFHMFKLIWENFIENYIKTNSTWAVNSRFKLNNYHGHKLSKYINEYLDKYQNWKDGLSNTDHGRRFKYYNDQEKGKYNELTVTHLFCPNVARKSKKTLGGEYYVDPEILNYMNSTVVSSMPDTTSEDESVAIGLHCIANAVQKIIDKKVNI